MAEQGEDGYKGYEEKSNQPQVDKKQARDRHPHFSSTMAEILETPDAQEPPIKHNVEKQRERLYDNNKSPQEVDDLAEEGNIHARVIKSRRAATRRTFERVNTLADQLIARHVSVYGEALAEQGVSTKISPEFLSRMERIQRFEGGELVTAEDHIDSKTGLPIEDLALRLRADEALTSAIKEADETGKKAAVIMADSDNLKVANDAFNHAFGDDMIRAGAVALSQVLEKYQQPGTKIFLMRGSGGADELKAVVTGLDAEQLAQLQEDVKQFSQRKTEIFIKDGVREPVVKDIKYTMSSSAGMVTSDDPEIRAIAKRQLSREAEGRSHLISREIFDQVMTNAEEQMMLRKMAKDIGRLDIEDLGRQQWVEGIKDILFSEIANTRISRALETAIPIFNTF